MNQKTQVEAIKFILVDDRSCERCGKLLFKNEEIMCMRFFLDAPLRFGKMALDDLPSGTFTCLRCYGDLIRTLEHPDGSEN